MEDVLPMTSACGRAIAAFMRALEALLLWCKTTPIQQLGRVTVSCSQQAAAVVGTGAHPWRRRQLWRTLVNTSSPSDVRLSPSMTDRLTHSTHLCGNRHL